VVFAVVKWVVVHATDGRPPVCVFTAAT
jgi:hypothetical protein